MKKLFAILTAICVMTLSGCKDNTEPESSVSSSTSESALPAAAEPTKPTEPTEPQKTPEESFAESGIIPEASQTERLDGKRLSYTVGNVWSQGEYYEVSISGVRCVDQSIAPTMETTYVNGELYGDFRLDLLKNGQRIGSLKIYVPRDDKFMILDSAAEGRDYGCALLSNMREFSAAEYPDIIQLDFFINGEGEVPQYARYFSVFDSRLAEVPVYENGSPAPPFGSYPEMKSTGLMVQHLTISSAAAGYRIAKFEYTFDLENRRLNKQEVKFYGWED